MPKGLGYVKLSPKDLELVRIALDTLAEDCYGYAARSKETIRINYWKKRAESVMALRQRIIVEVHQK